MKITIEPSQNQDSEKYPHNAVTIKSPHDDLTIGEVMDLVVKSLQAWGFQNENIAEHLEEEFAWSLGLKKDKPYKSTYTSEKDKHEENWHSKNDKTSENGGV